MTLELFWMMKPANVSVKPLPGSNVIVPMFAERPRNYLLSALPAKDWDAIASHFEKAYFQTGRLLIHEGDAFSQLYFPVDCVISTLAVFESGATVEMAAVGREGMAPLGSVAGSDISLAQQIVKIPGSAMTIPFQVFRRIQKETPAFSILVDAYAQAFMAQLLRSVACNAVHTVEQRAARLLLMYHDQAGQDTFPLTQEFFAVFLGAGRPTVNIVYRHLREAGAIRFKRGQVTVVDRRGLENAACECHAIINRHYEKYISGAIAAINDLSTSKAVSA
jgi:CRP-like cAMP-binding protein